MLRIVIALVEHDLPRAADELAAGGRHLLEHDAVLPPLPYVGASALVHAAIGRADAGAQRTLAVTQVPANRGVFAWADAITHGRAGRREEAAALLADGEEALAGLPWWRRLLHTVVLDAAVGDGWGDPVPTLRADLAVHEQRATSCSRAPAATCSAVPGHRPPAAGAAPRCPLGCAPEGSRRGRPRCSGWSSKA